MRHAYLCVVYEIRSEASTFDDFLNLLVERGNQPCYAVLDYCCDSIIGSTLCFVHWCVILFIFIICRVPDDATVKSKLIYAGSKDAIRKLCEGIKFEVQASELSDITSDDMTKRARSAYKSS
ncbi:unnamed protein product [Protopolystoma xenopodis]|uniref:ADF-H domain-containing protein n=1 Tax=Protopolystoma xenopodis TaxID=117903 RepID=A0A3S5A7A5_9PLAT|nr:unnamed protein product [Protopolystoma xenopodis]